YKRFHIPEDGTSILPNPLENVVLFYSMQPSKRTEATYRDILEIAGTTPIYYHDNYGPDMGILEVFSSAASKANALRKLKEQTGAERVVVFGDNINDIPMMREADVAVAVDNAVADVKEIADIIIGANTTDSVARFILDSLKAGEVSYKC
ncbi:MAG: HAD hydrolase family protein, partial [Muribaculaceae bacterium]|nr:HAD hydrolase family protein [Muribaculaceae bacterium]